MLIARILLTLIFGATGLATIFAMCADMEKSRGIMAYLTGVLCSVIMAIAGMWML